MENVAAVVLAGGRSRRMGRDKAAVVLGGRTLLQRTVDAAAAVAGTVVVVGAPGRRLPPIETARPLTAVTDAVEGQGPLAGIIEGLEAVEAPVALVLGCDQPFVRPALLELLVETVRDHVATLPLLGDQAQPLCSAVQREALPLLRQRYEAGARAAMVLAELPGAVLLPDASWRNADPDARSFIGVNTPEQLRRAEALLCEFEL